MTDPALSFKEIGHATKTTAVAVKKYMDSKNIAIPKIGKSYKIESSIARNFLETKGVTCPREVVAVENCKGGVGKTFTTHTLASVHSMFWGGEPGYKTLAIDFDFQGNLTTSFNVSKKIGENNGIYEAHTNNIPIKDCIVPVTPNLDLIPANSSLSLLDNQFLVEQIPLDLFLKRLLKPIREQYSCIFIDCPPRISASTTAINLYSSIVLFVTDLDEFAVDGIETMFSHMGALLEKYEKIEVNPKIFINKYDAREHLSFNYIHELKLKYDDILMNSYISKSSIVKNSFRDGKLIWDNPRTSPIFNDSVDVYLELFNLTNQVKSKTKQ